MHGSHVSSVESAVLLFFICVIEIVAWLRNQVPTFVESVRQSFYVAEVKYHDGRSWERGPEKKPDQIQSSLVLTPRFPAKM